MSTRTLNSNAARRGEAERLIELTRALLTDESEQIAVLYLDHALAALDGVSSEESLIEVVE